MLRCFIKTMLLQTAVLVILMQACAHGGPYKGRVVEATDNQPIAGAVVVISWTYSTPNVGGGSTHCLDADEAVTDANGEFEIPERKVGPFGRVGNANFAIYKVGYERIGPGPWESLKSAKYFLERVIWEGDRAIIPLKRVAKEDLKWDGRPPQVSCGRKDEKPLSEYIRIREEFRVALGLRSLQND